MGLHGPLTALALGRSPYDAVVYGDGVDGEVVFEDGVDDKGAYIGQDDDDPRLPQMHDHQMHDHRGRPVNPATDHMNRDIIRAHNEVMHVIGVAEPENPHSGPEVESQRRHEEHEYVIGRRLTYAFEHCIDAVGILGLDGFYTRILTYRRYALVPLWDLVSQARQDFSLSRDVLAGFPTSFVSLCLFKRDKEPQDPTQSQSVGRRIFNKVGWYFEAHLDLYVDLQRLNLMSGSLCFPPPTFFIPFTESSPIPAPPPLQDIKPSSIVAWLAGALVSTTPFVLSVLLRRWKGEVMLPVFAQIYRQWPNTYWNRRELPPPPPPPPAPPPPPPAPPLGTASEEALADSAHEPSQLQSPVETTMPRQADESVSANQVGGPDSHRRASVISTRGEEFLSDDEETGAVSATLISFDVEASESPDTMPGLWSAELRPSAGIDSRGDGAQHPAYLDTMLTRLSVINATYIFSRSAIRLMAIPWNATYLRHLAHMFCSRQGLTSYHIFGPALLSGVTSTWIVNLLGSQLLHLVVTTELWGVFHLLQQQYHMNDEEWKAHEAQTRREGEA